MKKVLITGANGMLGQDLATVLERNNFSVIKTDVDNMDITNISSVESFINDSLPNFVVHCAAYTNVDKAEEDRDTAFLINHKGSENLAIVTGKLNIPIIAISTDYVFEGNKGTPYIPSDKTNPQGVYGASKLAGELAVIENNPKHFICRTSWLYGKNGKNFVDTMIELSAKMPQLKVVDDQKGCPTWTIDFATAIVKIIDENMSYGIYHTCGAGETTWYGFTKEIFRLKNIATEVSPCTSDEFPRPAKRPHYSVMDNKGLLRDWKLALSEYLTL